MLQEYWSWLRKRIFCLLRYIIITKFGDLKLVCCVYITSTLTNFHHYILPEPLFPYIFISVFHLPPFWTLCSPMFFSEIDINQFLLTLYHFTHLPLFSQFLLISYPSLFISVPLSLSSLLPFRAYLLSSFTMHLFLYRIFSSSLLSFLPSVTFFSFLLSFSCFYCLIYFNLPFFLHLSLRSLPLFVLFFLRIFVSHLLLSASANVIREYKKQEYKKRP